ncbi:MAG: rod shape-determining protein MreC [Bdellovibrio sp. CG12_big_fil_rev_8_21_14_0_65_39_13]|nr:MAG: rod shape-determining protein MreC [Bdellovibrio sp. CG22_combo_CG10-13_8_21_14_all_39_27]PIQ58172.1 MAG: rod shape-determining protein MreC [Bdellovibrio sp. CG12_big_fil_rev_8_21_14_0_65_39_13]PIR34334.1 MAG: rod shape-determining protein MreC [Bdellovibrio sp. CG11_big_fil_rev_8_21_14_0_20_39_38]
MNIVSDKPIRSKIIINTVVILLSLFSYTRRDDVLQQTSAFDNLLVDTFAPLQKGMSFIQTSIQDVLGHYIANVGASKNNVVLKKQVEEYKSQLFSMDELNRENERLKELLKFSSDLTLNRVLAQVIAWDASSDLKVLRINKGLKQGLRLQDPVITAQGLVGYIYRITGHFADVLTILDPNNRVDILVERTRSNGVLEGYSSSSAILKYISRTEPVILGDILMTSGLGNVYPKGIRVGTISRIERESYGITQYIEVTPSVDFGKLEEVVVLTGQFNSQKLKEIDALENQDDHSK